MAELMKLPEVAIVVCSDCSRRVVSTRKTEPHTVMFVPRRIDSLMSKRTLILSTVSIVVGCVVLHLSSRISSPTFVISGISTNTTTLGLVTASAAMNTDSKLNVSIRMHRILAYGDSLTAGTSGRDLFPYAVYLEQGLQQQRGDTVIVRHRGNPGMTAAEMINNLDGPRRGLRNAIQAVTNPTLSIVIILAGTNDLGFALATAGTVDLAAQQIMDNLLSLHKVCAENGIPRTIAIGIPPSGYQMQNEQARNLASLINHRLECHAEETAKSSSCSEQQEESKPLKMTYMPFPFSYERNGENWNSDTLHFSEKGYQVLGESLVPVVDRILQAIDNEDEDESTRN
jgi:lysophospholipase L1-like esterase